MCRENHFFLVRVSSRILPGSARSPGVTSQFKIQPTGLCKKIAAGPPRSLSQPLVGANPPTLNLPNRFLRWCGMPSTLTLRGCMWHGNSLGKGGGGGEVTGLGLAPRGGGRMTVVTNQAIINVTGDFQTGLICTICFQSNSPLPQGYCAHSSLPFRGKCPLPHARLSFYHFPHPNMPSCPPPDFPLFYVIASACSCSEHAILPLPIARTSFP